ncbi:MAG: recombination mediator RecR [Cyanophyceae cyanobacterium]
MPGIGPKSAQRLALHLLKRPDAEIEALANALLEAKSQVGQCRQCFHLSAEPLCSICQDMRRDRQTLCVVTDSREVIALEKTREFRGLYHVLGGVISPMDGVGPEALTIQQLVQRVAGRSPSTPQEIQGGQPSTQASNLPKIKEVILAIGPSVEGETTTLYIAQLIKPFTKVTRIAFGLPVGGDLEYADEVTLARALEGRQELE